MLKGIYRGACMLFQISQWVLASKPSVHFGTSWLDTLWRCVSVSACTRVPAVQWRWAHTGYSLPSGGRWQDVSHPGSQSDAYFWIPAVYKHGINSQSQPTGAQKQRNFNTTPEMWMNGKLNTSLVEMQKQGRARICVSVCEWVGEMLAFWLSTLRSLLHTPTHSLSETIGHDTLLPHTQNPTHRFIYHIKTHTHQYLLSSWVDITCNSPLV